MAFTLGDVITAARDRSAAFHRSKITDAVFARFLTDAQNDCIADASRRVKGFLVQSASIVLATSTANAVGTVGAGTSGGLPGTIDDAGDVTALESPAGSAIEDATSDAVVLVAESVVASATSTTLVKTSAGWTVNAYTDQLVTITGGTGKGQVRSIASNTSDTLTVTDAWTTTPDSTSLFTVVASDPEADADVAVVTQVPATSTRRGYLVKLDASGVPYIDYTEPLVGTYDVGCPLPSHLSILGASVRYGSSDRIADLKLQGFAGRLSPIGWPAAWVEGESLFLCGRATDWTDVTSIDVRYVPIAPAFTALTDYFLLPDSAKSYLVAKAAAFAGDRLAGTSEITVNVDALHAQAQRAESAFYTSLSSRKAARVSRVKETW